jgi:hypothetical protein
VQRRRPSSRGSAPRRASPETVGSCVISVRLLPPVSLPCSSLCPSTAYATSPSSLSKCAGELDAVKERGGGTEEGPVVEQLAVASPLLRLAHGAPMRRISPCSARRAEVRQLLLAFWITCGLRMAVLPTGKGIRGYPTLLGKGKGIKFYPWVRVRV